MAQCSPPRANRLFLRAAVGSSSSDDGHEAQLGQRDTRWVRDRKPKESSVLRPGVVKFDFPLVFFSFHRKASYPCDWGRV